MSTNKTENLSLHSWDQDDPVLRSEFNENFEAIDSAFGTTWADVMAGPKVVVGSYVGTGTYGQSSPTTLTFSFQPKLLILLERASSTGTYNSSNGPWFFVYGVTSQYSMSGKTGTVVYSGNTVRWYTTTGTSYEQHNITGTTYYYLAIG